MIAPDAWHHWDGAGGEWGGGGGYTPVIFSHK